MPPVNPDYIVDLNCPDRPADSPSETDEEPSCQAATMGSRPFISIFFSCCSLYQRVYRNRTATAYEGVCPGCLRRIHVKIGPDGTNSRFFTAI